MEKKEIVEKINSFLVDELDSLDYIDLVVVIESNFGFKVKPEDFTNIVTFEDFCNYVISKVNSKELV
jgi:acyl carrier protein